MTNLHLSEHSASRWVADLLVQERTEPCAQEVQREELCSFNSSRVNGRAKRSCAEHRKELLSRRSQLDDIVVLNEHVKRVHRSSPINHHHAASRLHSKRIIEENMQDFNRSISSICSSNGRRRSGKEAEGD